MLYKVNKQIESRSASGENPAALAGSGATANNGRKGSPCIVHFMPGECRTLLDVEGRGIIRRIWMTLPPNNRYHMRNLILRMYWDNQDNPSVEVPLGDFFGIAHGRQRHMVSDLVGMQDGKGLNCLASMPFLERAKITIENDSLSEVTMLFYQINFTLNDDLTTKDELAYFDAQFRRLNPCLMRKDYTILDGVEGEGCYIGTVLGIRERYREPGAWWGEGEVKFYIDDDLEYPTICGTGAEDYVGNAWGVSELITPNQGSPICDVENGYYSLYRWHLKDPVYFHKKLKVTIQQLGAGSKKAAEAFFGEEGGYYTAVGEPEDGDIKLFERSDDYCSVAYWYQTLPTVKFPELPDRDQRSRDI